MTEEERIKAFYMGVNLIEAYRDKAQEFVDNFENILGVLRNLKEQWDLDKERIENLKEAIEVYDAQNKHLKKDLRKFTRLN